MLEASASALQWEYFEYVYKEMTLSGHQVNLRKHSSLLVEASKSGKWHLLEHAFDSILEGGEIPPVSLFNKMTCQAIIRHDYGRAVNIINTMALAPSQVSFQEWVKLFEQNRERIDEACLDELREEIDRHDLVKEATVLNLFRALQFLCGSCEDSLHSIASTSQRMEKLSEDSPGEDFDSCDSINEQNSPVNTTTDSGFIQDINIWEEESLSRRNNHEENVRTSPTRFADRYDFDLVPRISPFYFDELEFEHIEYDEEHSDDDDDEFNFELIVPSSKVDDSNESKTPSAYEILEAWKKK